MEEAGDGGGQGGQGQGGQGQGGAWYDGFKAPEVKEWLKAYGDSYPDPESVALKAFNLEKFVGADKAGRGVITPKPDAKPEEWAEFYRKVGGVPDKPDGYKVADDLAKDPFVGKFREFAHKAGMPPTFFTGMLDWYTSEAKAIEEQQVNAFSAQAERDLLDLKTEWAGAEYDKNIELGRRAAKQFIPYETQQELENTLASLEGAIGTKNMLKLWASIGQGLGEHNFVMGEGSGGHGGTTAEGARMKIAELKKDSAWNARFAAGDADARAEWDRLHKIGYSNQ
jgi:hypothetical protein